MTQSRNISSNLLLPGILILFLVFSGCSGKKEMNPISPSIEDNTPVSASQIPYRIPTGQYSFTGLLGVYDIHLNPSFKTGEISPLRFSEKLGDTYNVDITSFLNLSPCADCIRLKALELESDGTVTVYIGARHPFPLPVDINNPLLTERLDLHVFDVEGILVLDGDVLFDSTMSDVDNDSIFTDSIISSAGILTNADGYTSIHDTFFDTILPTQSNIHPYKIFAFDPTSGNYNPTYDPANGFPYLDNPTGHNVFPQGSGEYVVEYNLRLDIDQQVDFLFALSASYGQSAQGKGTDLGKRLNPRYFLPEFHRKEPWMVKAEVKNNQLAGYTPSSNAVISVEIFDWQHEAFVDPAFDPLNSSLTMTSRASKIREVSVEIPAFGKWIDEGNMPAVSGNGSYSNPYKFQFVLYNDSLLSEGTYFGLVAARDDLEGSELVMGVQRDGTTLFLINDFTTYQVISIDVGPADFPPEAVIETIPDPPEVIESSQPITFDGTSSSDDGIIVLYEWDFDYTGIGYDFHADMTGGVTQHTFPTPGKYTVALRVTDNHTPEQQDIATVDVIVFCNSASVGSCAVSNVPQWLTTSHNESWKTMDGKIDCGFLLNGDIVIEDDKELGRADISPAGGAAFIPFINNYPGVSVGSIDVDRKDNVIWVGYTGPESVIIGGVQERNEKMLNVIHVYSLSQNAEIAGVSLSQFGDYIQAVETDEANNVWVIMNMNRLIKLRQSDYAIVKKQIFKLNEISGDDIGYIFDFAKNFHNDCFYILTNSSQKGSLYRFECDVSFQPDINGNPNPLENVFQMVGGFQIIELFGDDALADIEIDNFAGAGYNNLLTEEQDCQIIMIACGLNALTQIYASKTVVNADLGIIDQEQISEGYGTHAIAIIPDGSNQIYSIVYGNEPYLPPGCSDKELDVYNPPSGWQ
jgi:hypothetical protein